MTKQLFAAGALALAIVFSFGSAQAAPASGIFDSLRTSASEQSLIEKVYCKKYRVCKGYGYNRRCYWIRRCH